MNFRDDENPASWLRWRLHECTDFCTHLSALTKMNAQDRCVSYKNDSSAKLIFLKKDAVFVLMVLTSGGE